MAKTSVFVYDVPDGAVAELVDATDFKKGVAPAETPDVELVKFGERLQIMLKPTPSEALFLMAGGTCRD